MLKLLKPFTQPLQDKLFEEKQVRVFVQREDVVHPFVSGNKWRKLKYNIEEFKRSGKEYLVTFGGAYSNHIVATAAAGKETGIKTIGIIRGEELTKHSNANLQFATECWMTLLFVSREDYRKKDDEKLLSAVLKDISDDMQSFYILPEGGANELAVKGCAEIVNDVSEKFDFILCACGTGATLAGIASSLNEKQQAIGISVLHGEEFLEKNIRSWMKEPVRKRPVIIHDYSFGGYAKSNKELQDFCNDFLLQHEIFIEPIYTGKLFYGLYDLIRKDYFNPHSRIVAVHTGPGTGIEF